MSVVERMIEVIITEDIDAFGDLYVEDATMSEPILGEPARGKAAIMQGEAALFQAFSDIAVEIKNEVRSGSLVLAEVEMAATNDGTLDVGRGEVPPTGRRITVPMVWVLELNDDGLIVEERDYFDTGVIMQQLGLDDGGTSGSDHSAGARS